MLALLFRSFRDSVARDYRDELWRRYLSLKLLKYSVWAGAIVLLALDLWSAWPYYITGLPANFEPGDSFLVLFVFLVYPSLLSNLYRASFSRVARSLTFSRIYPVALRSAIVAGDATLAPIADDAQFDAIPSAEVSEQTPEMFAPLAHPMRSLETAGIVYVLGVFAGLALLALGGWFMAPPSPPSSSSADAAQFMWSPAALMFPAIFAVFGVVVIGWALSAWRLEQIERRGLVAVADAEGVTVSPAGGSRHSQRLRWANARGYARLRYVDGMSRAHTLYLLTTETDDLLWDEPPVSRYMSPAEAVREEALRDTARRLARVVEQRTGLPLRDVSMIMRAVQIGAEGLAQPSATLFDHALNIAREQGDVPLATRLWLGTHPGAGEAPADEVSRTRRAGLYLSTTPAQREDIVRFALALLPYYPTQEQTRPDRRELRREGWKQRSRTWDDAFTRILLLVVILLSMGSYGLSHWYAPPLLRSLPAQASAQAPTYLTSFSAAQPDWPTRAPSSGATRSAHFTSSGYELSTQDPNQAEGAWSSVATSGDNAFELMFKLTSASSADSSASGGLLLNVSPDGSSALAFTIDASGGAQVARCHGLNTLQGACDAPLTYVDWPESAHAANVGAGVVNTLLVIRRGLLYIFYVNGAPVIVFRDPTGSPGADGFVGVYLDTGAATADFLRLAVYPLPAGMPFWAR